SISLVRTRCIPMVSSRAAAISDVGLVAADHPVDGEHYPHIRPMALARPWASGGGASWLGHARGIRMRGNSCCDDRCARDQPMGRAQVLHRLAALRLDPQLEFC